MKFTELFEESAKRKMQRTPKYDQTIINHVKGLIEKSFKEEDSKDELIQQGKELLFDKDNLSTENNYYLNDPNDSDISESPVQSTKDFNKPVQRTEESESFEQSSKTDSDYFLNDDVYNNALKAQSESLGVDFKPQTYEEDSEYVSAKKNTDYFLDDPETPEEVSEKSSNHSDISAKSSNVSAKRNKSENLTESPEEVKELKDNIKDIDPEENPENPEALKVYDKLIDMIQDKDYEDTVDFLDDIVKDPKLKFMLSLGFGGEFSNLKLKLKKVNIPAKRLIPTQSEIGTDETLRYIIEGKDIDVCFEKQTIVKKPIVTFQGTFIIDGHHRWSQIFVTNPEANVVCIDISGNLSPISMLKAVQCTIASNLGKLIHKNVKGLNLYDISEKEIRKYLEDKLPESVIENLEKYYEDPIEALTENALQMQRNNTPILNAPERGEMPQTSKDPELFGDLKKGVTEV